MTRSSTIPDGTVKSMAMASRAVEADRKREARGHRDAERRRALGADLVTRGSIPTSNDKQRADLLRRARRGDPEAVADLWRLYRCRLIVGPG